jgi:hypothetical protein
MIKRTEEHGNRKGVWEGSEIYAKGGEIKAKGS